MHTYFIHINGQVQGVGFRPHVYRKANEMNLKGQVSNTNQGVHIECNATKEKATAFLESIIKDAPSQSIITQYSIQQVEEKKFVDFKILSSSDQFDPSILITPDFALCEDCKKDIDNPSNKRYQYPFTTCTQCGPRYSISKALPYDRVRTTMSHYHMCEQCASEYQNILDRRYYSQTNSCPSCAIQMQLYNNQNQLIDQDQKNILEKVNEAILNGKIVAIKNTGGYLLVCDATNKLAILNLRARKQRPTKPLAIMYPNMAMAKLDVEIRPIEANALESTVAPIVLCKTKSTLGTNIQLEQVNQGLDKIGVLLPNSGLLYLLAKHINKPMVATSGNVSGSPIIFKDKEALINLAEIADFILVYDREILIPQDDSVILFSENEHRIILRRSRGLAPNYLNILTDPIKEQLLATGGEIKSAFAYSHHQKVFVSQFLGDQSILESQEAYQNTLSHFEQMLKLKPSKILIDLHPNYVVAEIGAKKARESKIQSISVQHHKAHFASVLFENELMINEKPVLGIIWDGTGFGEDNHIWGSEVFIWNNHLMSRVAHLQYFPVLLADKMSKEPRLSALSLLKKIQADHILQNQFSAEEWHYYKQLLQKPSEIQTCSMGRFLDGICAILGIKSKSNHEAEPEMLLESLARTARHNEYYNFEIVDSFILWEAVIIELIIDIDKRLDITFIARKVINSLARVIKKISEINNIKQVAFSGGVFQNALLIDTIIELMGNTHSLYFQKELSPNDEGIALGQMAYYIHTQNSFII